VQAGILNPAARNESGINPMVLFSGSGNSMSGGVQTDWSPVNTSYEWRVCFAPDEVGWFGYANIWMNGQLQSQTNVFDFTVIAGTGPGFV